ncbi:glycosyltransferase family 4 protein [Vibrio caribbeanicus]|uniref:glycosyltransferase family 4 protein n=1 Tax=Vibrio caribbeanicus TaxID=701175 RepID=UPI0030D70263
MKVNVGVVGRFHAFNLAEQLNKHCLLNRLVTTYPKFKAAEWGIDKNLIVSELSLEILNRYRKKIPFLRSELINEFVKKAHAKNCSKYLDGCDIHIGWSGSSVETIQKTKREGKVFILERGSSHYSYQMNILEEEHKRCGSKEFVPSYDIWQRELLEYELADYISIPSSFVKRTFVEFGIDERKLLVNPYGVNLQEFKQIPKEDETFRIIFAGGGCLRKGYHYLLQAFYELNLDNCEVWHLGTINEEIKPYLKKYHHKNWILKGNQPQAELHKYYSQGSVFVLPSLEDGFGMVLFQAMACGLPLICTTNTGGEDLISEDGCEGFVVPIRDVEALKEKILFLYNNQSLARSMGNRAKQKVIDGFSWDDYGRRYIENLNKIDLTNEK